MNGIDYLPCKNALALNLWKNSIRQDIEILHQASPSVCQPRICLMSPHVTSDQMLAVGTAWERGCKNIMITST